MAASWIEVTGAFFGLLGTFLLARSDERSGWGFVVYLASNVAWLWFAAVHGHWAVLVQYLGFTAVSVYGIWRWLAQPRRAASVPEEQPLHFVEGGPNNDAEARELQDVRPALARLP
jgi:nicotinamide riboside transporter PnuC